MIDQPAADDAEPKLVNVKHSSKAYGYDDIHPEWLKRYCALESKRSSKKTLSAEEVEELADVSTKVEAAAADVLHPACWAARASQLKL